MFDLSELIAFVITFFFYALSWQQLVKIHLIGATKAWESCGMIIGTFTDKQINLWQVTVSWLGILVTLWRAQYILQISTSSLYLNCIQRTNIFGTWVVHGKGIINKKQQQLWKGWINMYRCWGKLC